MVLTVCYAVLNIEELRANGVTLFLSSPTGGTAQVEYQNNQVHVINTSGARLRITSVNAEPCYHVASPDPYAPQCVAGMVLSPNAPNNFCYVEIDYDFPLVPGRLSNRVC